MMRFQMGGFNRKASMRRFQWGGSNEEASMMRLQWGSCNNEDSMRRLQWRNFYEEALMRKLQWWGSNNEASLTRPSVKPLWLSSTAMVQESSIPLLCFFVLGLSTEPFGPTTPFDWHLSQALLLSPSYKPTNENPFYWAHRFILTYLGANSSKKSPDFENK